MYPSNPKIIKYNEVWVNVTELVDTFHKSFELVSSIFHFLFCYVLLWLHCKAFFESSWNQCQTWRFE